MLNRFALVAAVLLMVPSSASALPALSPGELSVAAELASDLGTSSYRKVSPNSGFLVRYALSHELAVYGELAFFHRFTEGRNPPAFYAIGGGAQFVPFSSKHASVLLRGGA